MLSYVAALWTIGVVCLIGAVVGDSLQIINVRFPAIRSLQARLAIAGIGVFSLVLGFVLIQGSSGQETAQGAPSSTPAPGLPSTTPARIPQPAPAPAESSASVPEAPTITDPPASTVVPVQWQGTLTLSGDLQAPTGWFLDSIPPSAAPLGDLGLGCSLSCAPGQLFGTSLAVWPGSGPPTRLQCRDLIDTHPGQRSVNVHIGSMFCIGTEGMRIASGRVLTMDDRPRLSLAVTVWEVPPA